MTDYPHGDALVPASFDEHTVILLVRPADAPTFGEEELDRLQAEHLGYLRDLTRRGVLIANGPLADQTDERLRGISIYALPLHQALELARADPMVRAGRLAIDGAHWFTASGTARFGSGDG
jgi:uncharacterized protein YciI